ncbi:nuclear receptor coactivator 1 [Cricetulus griseus]|nr:nuclear receptor coactivator 1 [Cricetulus griseus]
MWRKQDGQYGDEPPLNAQMLAQRQRELYSQQHRQRQIIQQQRAMLMRHQSFGNSIPPSSGLTVKMGNPSLPQDAPQQFPYPPNYGTNPGTPPASTSPLSQLAANPEASLATCSSMVNRGMAGNMGGQFGTGINPQMQQNIFQYPRSGNASTDICLQRIVSSSALRRYKVVGHNINGGGNRRRNKSTERSNKAFRVTDVIVVDGGHLQTVLLTSRNSHR